MDWESMIGDDIDCIGVSISMERDNTEREKERQAYCTWESMIGAEENLHTFLSTGEKKKG